MPCRVFAVLVSLWCVKRHSKTKIGFRHLNALRSSFKVPAPATPIEVDRVSVQNRVWVSEWVVTSCQEVPNPASLCHRCFRSGEEFSSSKNKQTEVVKSNLVIKQAKQKHEVLRCPWSDVIRHESFILRPTSSGVAEARTFFQASFYGKKSIGIYFIWFECIFRRCRDAKTQKLCWPYGYVVT